MDKNNNPNTMDEIREIPSAKQDGTILATQFGGRISGTPYTTTCWKFVKSGDLEYVKKARYGTIFKIIKKS